MTPLAFYAPLKAPTHPTPSGDRQLARSILAALELAGFAPNLAAKLRIYDKHGDAQVQTALRAEVAALLPQVIAQGRAQGWRAWLTYHNYYKAPDLLGPRAAKALGIPYLQIESTRARKRLAGPWAGFAEAAEAAADAAHTIFYFTQRDSEALVAYGPPEQVHIHLRPFLLRSDLPPQSTRAGPIFSAAMMRAGDKLASYRLIADSLLHVTQPWQLDIAGDGPSRAEVAALMEPFGNRVRFLGELDAGGMAEAYRGARLLFWPGVNEAIGLTYLEAQAAGIPVLAQDRPGLRDVLPPDAAPPSPEGGAKALAARLDELLASPPEAEGLRTRIAEHHLLPVAAATLKQVLDRVT